MVASLCLTLLNGIAAARSDPPSHHTTSACCRAQSPARSGSAGRPQVRAKGGPPLAGPSSSSSSSSEPEEWKRAERRSGRVPILTDFCVRWYVNDMDSEVCE